MSNFYSSGGLNDSTGREPFEDGTPLVRQGGNYDANASSHSAPGAGNALGDGNLVATTGPNQGEPTGFANQTAGHSHHNHGEGHHHSHDESATDRLREGTNYNTTSSTSYDNSSSNYDNNHNHSHDHNNTSSTGKPSLVEKAKNALKPEAKDRNDYDDNAAKYSGVGDNYGPDSHSRGANTGGLTGGFGNTEGSHSRVKDQLEGRNEYGTGINETSHSKSSLSGGPGLSSGQTGDSYNPNANRATGDDYSGNDRSAAFGRDGGIGNQGVGSGLTSSSGPATSGAAGTDRFDVDRSTSGTTYGQDIGDKRNDNNTAARHGDDFTGGFAATGGAYTNPNTKTGLTGRETTTSGVQDQHGQPTQSSGGLLGKIKHAVGLDHDKVADANNSTSRDNY